MPGNLIEWFKRKPIEFHFCLALVLALICRLLTAYFSYGPLAMDDYLDGIAPALQRSHGLPSPVNPGRSYLIVLLMAGFLKIGEFFGIYSQAVSQVRLAYAGLGVFSLLTLLGGYLYTKLHDDKCFGALLLYLLAVDAFMPLASTRAFGEAVSMSWIFLGLGLAEWSKAKDRQGYFFLGVLLLGVGALFRYQCGLIFVTYLAIVFFQKRYRLFLLGILAGCLTLCGEIVSDLIRDRSALETFFVYLKRTEGGAAMYGVQPWYVFVTTLIAASYFPFSLTLISGIPAAIKKHSSVFICFFVFVVAHSLILHKEERFLFPILPLFLTLLAATWSEVKENRWVKRFYFPSFLVLNAGFLWLVMFNNSQAGLIEPVVRAQQQAQSGVFLEIDTPIHSHYLSRDVFLRQDFIFLKAEASEIHFETLEKIFQSHPQRAFVMILTFQEMNSLKMLSERSKQNISCGPLHQSSSISDRILYGLNPKHNVRRRPVYFVECRKK